MEETNDDISGIGTDQGKKDSETGQVSWDVKYKANYALVYKMFKNLHANYKDFVIQDEIKSDPKFVEIFKGLTYIWNQFRTHLRTNYPKHYKRLQSIQEEELKELIHAHLREMSSTGGGAGAATFSPGEGENYATPKAFNPNKKAKGTANLKPGWKLADKINEEDSKQYVDSLNLQEPAVKNFITTRITDFDKIEDKLNILLPLLKKAKTETMEYYKNSPDFKVQYGTDLAVDYLDDLITLFRDKK